MRATSCKANASSRERLKGVNFDLAYYMAPYNKRRSTPQGECERLKRKIVNAALSGEGAGRGGAPPKRPNEPLRAAIGRIAPWPRQERRMIVRLRVGDGASDRRDVEERRLGRLTALGAKIRADMEREFERADARLRGANERGVGAPVGVGANARDQLSGAVRSKRVQFDRDAARRAPARRVEDVGVVRPAMRNSYPFRPRLADDLRLWWREAPDRRVWSCITCINEPPASALPMDRRREREAVCGGRGNQYTR